MALPAFTEQDVEQVRDAVRRYPPAMHALYAAVLLEEMGVLPKHATTHAARKIGELREGLHQFAGNVLRQFLTK